MDKENLATKSNQDWIAWGRTDPLYGVATVPGRSRFDGQPWTEQEFYSLGGEWEQFRGCWQRYGLIDRSCVEIGSGAGRLTRRLARDFATVNGLDVSPEQIEFARRRMPENVTLHVTDGATIPLAEASATAVFSTHVFQHFESLDLATAVFREIHRVLVPGGTMMVHVPLVIWPSGFLSQGHRALHVLRGRIAKWRSSIHRLAFKHGLSRLPLARWTSYEVDWVHGALRSIGFVDTECTIVFIPTGMFEGSGKHCFVFARKP